MIREKSFEMKKSLGPETIVYPTPVFLIGTYDQAGHPNIMTCAWGGICCSRPPCVAISIRYETRTYENITQRRCFTLSIPSIAQMPETDWVGGHSGADGDKFQETGLTPTPAKLVSAPYVDECPIVLECNVVNTIRLGGHVQFIGEILDLKADESVLDQNGHPMIQLVQPIIFSPNQKAYFGLGEYVADAFQKNGAFRSGTTPPPHP